MQHIKAQTIFKLALFLFVGFCLTACDFFVSTEQRYEKAQSLFAEQNYQTAAIELKKILQKQPDNHNARVLLGKTQLWLGQAKAAEQHFEKALKGGISKEVLAIPLAKAYLANGKFIPLLDSLPVEILKDSADRAMLLSLRGKALFGLEEYQDARTEFNRALALVNGHHESRLGLARVALAKGSKKEAGSLINAVLADAPDHNEALLMKAQFKMLSGDYEQAEAAFAQLLKNDSRKFLPTEEFLVRAGLAESQYRQGKLEQMRESVEQLVVKYPRHPTPKYMQALVSYASGEYSETVNHLQILQNIAPNYPAVDFLMGASSYALDNLEQANLYLSRAVQAEPSNKQAQKLLAITFMRLNQPDKATGLLQSMLQQGDTGTDGELLFMLGKASMQAGETDLGLSYIEQGVRQGKSEVAARLELAAAYIASGKLDMGIGVLEQLPESKEHDYRKDMLLVLAAMKRKDLTDALTLTEKLLKKYPDNFAMLSLAGSVSMLAGQLAEAQKYYQAALKLDPQNTGAMINLGRLKLLQRNLPAASEQFQQVLKLQPENQTALLMLAAIAMDTNRPKDAERQFRQAVEVNANAVQPWVSLIKFYLSQRQYPQAENAAAEALQKFPQNEILLSGMSAALSGQGKSSQVEALLEDAIKGSEKPSALLYLNLAKIKSSKGDLNSAQSLLSKALELAPNSVAVLAGLAGVEAGLGRYTRALQLVGEAQRKEPDSIRLLELEGDILVEQKNYADAEKMYRRIFSSKASGGILIKIARVQQAAGKALPEAELLRWLDSNPQDMQIRLFLAQNYQKTGRKASAIVQYEAIVAMQPENAMALNNLAWLYHLEDNAKAVETAKEAYRLRPDQGAIVDTLGWILVERGQHGRGVELLREAVKKAPDIPAIQYHLAVGLYKQGDRAEARSLLGRLLADKGVFQERNAAEALYAKLR